MPMPTEADIVALEKRYWDAIVAKDTEGALELTDDPSIIVGAQGVGKMSKASIREMMKQDQKWVLHKYDFQDPKVQVLNENTAVIAYKVREEMTVEGKPLILEASDSSTWIRKDGKWVCSLHTEAIEGDAFGRDRKEKH